MESDMQSIFALQRETAQQLENVVNRIHRHCRIKNVRQKVQIRERIVPPDFTPALPPFPPNSLRIPSIPAPNTCGTIEWWQNPVYPARSAASIYAAYKS
jgi:hypothetical protein